MKRNIGKVRAMEQRATAKYLARLRDKTGGKPEGKTGGRRLRESQYAGREAS